MDSSPATARLDDGLALSRLQAACVDVLDASGFIPGEQAEDRHCQDWLGGRGRPLAVLRPRDSFASQVDAILATDPSIADRLSEVTAPTLVVVGNQDILTPRGDSEELAERIPGAELVVIAGAVNVKANDATMKAELNTRGLEKLLGGYGIEVRKDVVLDYGRSMRLQMLTQGGLAIARFPQVLDVIDDPRFSGQEQLLDTNFPAFFRIQELAFPLASSVAVQPEKQPEAKLQILARSTPRALVEKSAAVRLSVT